MKGGRRDTFSMTAFNPALHVLWRSSMNTPNKTTTAMIAGLALFAFSGCFHHTVKETTTTEYTTPTDQPVPPASTTTTTTNDNGTVSHSTTTTNP
jgi:hypothetical protein